MEDKGSGEETEDVEYKEDVMRLRKEIYTFFADESGVGVIEIVLILVVLIGLVLVFKKQINLLLEGIFKQINSSSKEVY